MSEFHKQLIAKTKELFPSLSDADLTPFLLHSRASRAYEAVWLMARAWDYTIRVGECSELEILQQSLETDLVNHVGFVYKMAEYSLVSSLPTPRSLPRSPHLVSWNIYV